MIFGHSLSGGTGSEAGGLKTSAAMASGSTEQKEVARIAHARAHLGGEVHICDVCLYILVPILCGCCILACRAWSPLPLFQHPPAKYTSAAQGAKNTCYASMRVSFSKCCCRALVLLFEAWIKRSIRLHSDPGSSVLIMTNQLCLLFFCACF